MRNGVGEAARPGYFNDLDFLQIGYGTLDDRGSGKPGMTDDEYRSEMSVFCLLAAPLIFSADLTRWTPAMASTLLNPELLAINQDPMAVAGTVVFNSTEAPPPGPTGGRWPWINTNLRVVYARPLHDGSVALGFMNRNNPKNGTLAIKLDMALIGVPKGATVLVRDAWARSDLGPNDSGAISRVVCGHCTDVLVVRLADGGRIDFKPWGKFRYT